MPESATELAVRRRREGRREEFIEQTKFVGMAAEYLDPDTTVWTSLENKPLSPVNGMWAKRKCCRSGLPDVEVIFRRKPGSVLIVFVELKSHRGVASKAQKQFRLELLRAGVAAWYMARSARAAMAALKLAGVVFCRPWEPPALEPWEGPFADPHQRLPQAPDVAERRREARRRSRERQRARRAARLAGERADAADADTAIET